MAIPEKVQERFDALNEAASLGMLSLLVCKSAKTGEPVYAVCVEIHHNEQVSLCPVGEISAGEPTAEFIPPGDPVIQTVGELLAEAPSSTH